MYTSNHPQGALNKIIIQLHNRCNNHCFFCNEDKTGEIRKNYIVDQIRLAANRGIRRIDFNGSEPTLNGRLFQYLAEAKSNNFSEITLFTNGRMFFYPDFCRKAAESGVTKIIFGIYSSREKIHDAITRVNGSFKQTICGIRNVRTINHIDIGGNIVFCRQDYRELLKTLRFFKKLGLRFFTISPVVSSLFGNKDKVNVDKAAIFKEGEIRSIIKNIAASGYTFVHFNLIPRCYFSRKDANMCKHNMRPGEVTIISEKGEKKSFSGIIKTLCHKKEECRSCSTNTVCPGIVIGPHTPRQYTGLWCVSDLHASRRTKRRVLSIFKDADSFWWSKGFFLGDSIEGDDGIEGYRVYAELLKTLANKKHIHHIVGNHEFTYSKGTPTLASYHKLIGNGGRIFFDHGNIRLITLSLDHIPARLYDCPPRTITYKTYNFLQQALRSGKDKIRIIFSHMPVYEMMVAGRRISLADALDNDSMPELWISGHTYLRPQALKKFKRTHFIDCSGGIHTMQSKLIIFERGTSRIIVKTRHHDKGMFADCDDILDFGKVYVP